MSDLSAAELLQVTALALLRHSVIDGGAGVPVTGMVSTPLSGTGGVLSVTYARRSEPVLLEYSEEDGAVRYICASNRFTILLTPIDHPIYSQEAL